MGHGWEGVVLKLFRGRDFTFTVTGAEQVTDRFHRVHLTDGGLLAATGGAHPTMWVRLWFEKAGKPHQRAYTLVDPDPEAGTFSLEFALHEGPACDWAKTAKAGDTIDATLQGTGFTLPDPAPKRLFVIGDPAALPRSTRCWTRSRRPRRRSGSRPPTRTTGNCRSGSTRPTTPCTPWSAARAGPIWWPR